MSKIWMVLVLLMVVSCENADVGSVFILKQLTKIAPCEEGCKVFTGDSITAWQNLEGCNLAIGGRDIAFIVGQFERIELLHPSDVYIMIGTNNIGHDQKPASEILPEYRAMVELYATLPDTVVRYLSILPFEPDYYNRNDIADELNIGIASICAESGVEFVDIHENFHDPALFVDGTHLNYTGSRLFKNLLGI